MEQRIGSTSPPVPPAGIDPAYIPGLTPPPPAEGLTTDAESKADIPPKSAVSAPEDAKPSRAEAADAEEATPDDVRAASDARTTSDTPAADDGDEEAAESSDASDPSEPETAAEAAEEDDDGLPVFKATDRRGAIIADRTGVTFRLDDQEAEFGWDEIGAVEIDTPRFGRRFSVTVYTSTRRWFQTDVDASSRSVLKQWTAELDAVLDARFEEGGPKEDPAAEVEADADAEAGAEADARAPFTKDADAPSDAEPAAAKTAEDAAEATATDTTATTGADGADDAEDKDAAPSKA